MIGLGLIVGHLVGDFLLQFDWLAKNKGNPFPKTWWRPNTKWEEFSEGGGYHCDTTPGTLEDAQEWDETYRKWKIGHVACFIHCLIYTACIWACSFWWMPVWGLVFTFLTHFAIDRFRLARKYMKVAGLEGFATGMFSSWSVVITDQAMHLLQLFVICAVLLPLS